MTITVKDIESLVGRAEWSFENARDRAEINVKIIDYGYGVPRLDELLDLTGRLISMYSEQQTLRGKQIIASNKFQGIYQAQRRIFINTRKLTIKVLKGEKIQEYLNLLGIKSTIKGTLDGFINQTRQFYTNAINDADLMAKLAKFNITVAKLQGYLDELPQLAELNKAHETIKALAQAARRDRDMLYKELKQEWIDFKDVCDMAFEDKEKDNPQYKELVGIVEFSEGYKPKKPTPPETPETPETPAE